MPYLPICFPDTVQFRTSARTPDARHRPCHRRRNHRHLRCLLAAPRRLARDRDRSRGPGRSGADFLRQRRPAGPRPRATLATGDTIEAAKIILATGAWSNPLARPNGQTARVESERGYHLSMHGANIMPAHPFMVADAQFVVTPMNGFLRAAGIVEFGGLQASASQAPFDLLEKQLKQVFPALTFARAEKWMGHRPTLPDSLPAIGESPAAPNIIHAYGGQHIGLTIGPRLGAMAAAIARGRRNSDTGAYRVGRRGVYPAPDSD